MKTHRSLLLSLSLLLASFQAHAGEAKTYWESVCKAKMADDPYFYKDGRCHAMEGLIRFSLERHGDIKWKHVEAAYLRHVEREKAAANKQKSRTTERPKKRVDVGRALKIDRCMTEAEELGLDPSKVGCY